MLRLFRRNVDPHQALIEVLGECELPSFPAIVNTALEQVRDEDASTASIAELVSTDPGITVRLLGTVNSAAFAMRHEVKNVSHAVSLLGRNQFESMLISVAVGDCLPRVPSPGYDPVRFWTTSARRAVTARTLAEVIDPTHRSESYTASLLQDLAVPILSREKGEPYGELLEHWHASDDNLAKLEDDAFGWNHAGVGECLCRTWKFPALLSEAIGVHHASEDEAEGSLPCARLVASLSEVNEEPGVCRLVETVKERYGLPEDQVVEMVRSSFEAADEVARMFV